MVSCRLGVHSVQKPSEHSVLETPTVLLLELSLEEGSVLSYHLFVNSPELHPRAPGFSPISESKDSRPLMLTSLSRSTSRDRPARAAWICALAAPALALLARSVCPGELSGSREVDLSDPLDFSEVTSGLGRSDLNGLFVLSLSFSRRPSSSFSGSSLSVIVEVLPVPGVQTSEELLVDPAPEVPRGGLIVETFRVLIARGPVADCAEPHAEALARHREDIGPAKKAAGISLEL